MKKKKFTRNKNQKKVIVFSVIGLFILVGVIVLCTKSGYNLSQGSALEYTDKDVKVAVIIDGNVSSTIPGKNDGYAFESVTCDNGAVGEWDNAKWGLFVNNLTNAKTTCSLVFKKMTFADYITILASTSEDLAFDGTVDNNLRYIGANPNNYVSFNNELWRIIGVMNNITDSEGNVGSHVKIIRNESIGNYPWSGSSSNTSNDWTQSTLNTEVLNGTYYNSLSSDAKNMISSVLWNLGGNGSSEYSEGASSFYTKERGNVVYGSNSVTWIGKIGLMYPSDYGYAVGGSVRNVCLEDNLGSYGIKGNNCSTYDWLFIGEGSDIIWTLTHIDRIRDDVFSINGVGDYKGYVSETSSANNEGAITPTLYLNSNIELTGNGDGSSTNPYNLKLEG